MQPVALGCARRTRCPAHPVSSAATWARPPLPLLPPGHNFSPSPPCQAGRDNSPLTLMALLSPEPRPGHHHPRPRPHPQATRPWWARPASSAQAWMLLTHLVWPSDHGGSSRLVSTRVWERMCAHLCEWARLCVHSASVCLSLHIHTCVSGVWSVYEVALCA